MGMPISSYNVMKVLDKGGERYETDAVRRALDPFNLFAFIIHDPETHPDFDRAISMNFDRLDHTSGDKLLFFALVDPPEEWLRYARGRSYHRLPFEAEQLYNPRNAITSTDRSITAFSLAKSLDIPYDSLPCLVITPNFSSHCFTWVRTDPWYVSGQINELGYIASRERIHSDPSSLQRIAARIDPCEGSRTKPLEVSLAKALADVLSFIIEPDNSEIRERVQNAITELANDMRVLKEEIEKRASLGPDHLEELYSQLDDLCEKIALFLSHLNSGSNSHLNDFIEIDTKLLEVDSRIILKTSHMLNDWLARSPTRIIDYTPVTLCLAKVFEREINLSVGHWLRQDLGIKLPRYFNKYQPATKAILQATEGAIDFNRRKDNKWEPPPIGASRRAYNLKADQMVHWLHLPIQQGFSEHWKTIQNERNDAAHTRVMNERSVCNIQNSLNNLSRIGVFEALYEMKNIGKNTGFP